MSDKRRRQQRISELVAGGVVRSQSELVEALRREGLVTTQATVSRDIAELGMVRRALGREKVYTLSPWAALEQRQLLAGVIPLLRDVDRGENLLVLGCPRGKAGQLAELLRSWQRDDIVGVLPAGDTVLLVARTVGDAEALQDELDALLGEGAAPG